MEKLSISILDINYTHLADSLDEFKNIGIQRIHLDVIDTSFCENISFGPNFINQVLEYDFIFDMHLMVDKPLVILKQINLDPIERVAVHHDFTGVSKFLNESISGIAINPSEIPPPDPPTYTLVMTVEAGFGGQKLKTDCIYKVKELQGSGSFCGIDGGITSKNVQLVRHSDLIVIGSDFVNSGDKEKYCRELMKNM